MAYQINATVLVPFPGFLYLYHTGTQRQVLNGISSRPLPGVLISLRETRSNKQRQRVLVPFPGFLYLYYV